MGGPEMSQFEWQGHALHYERHGAGTGVPLVWIHGLLADRRMDRRLARALAAEGREVVLLDLLGHGDSAGPARASAYRIDVYAEQVVALLDHLGLDRAVLGGLSLGADVSLYAATQAPERVAGLVLDAPVLEWAAPAAALAFVPPILALRAALPLARLAARVARRIPATGFDIFDVGIGRVAKDPVVTISVVHGLLLGPVAPPVERRQEIQVPTLVFGHRGDLIHPFNDAGTLARQVADGRHVPTRTIFDLRVPTRAGRRELAAFLGSVDERRVPRRRRAAAG